MQKIGYLLILMISALGLLSCAAPNMQQLPPKEPNRGTLILYSSTLYPTQSYDLYIDGNKQGDVEGGKVRVVYLTPGTHTVKFDVSSITRPLEKAILVKNGEYYFMNVYSTAYNRSRTSTAFYLDLVPRDQAMSYLRSQLSLVF